MLQQVIFILMAIFTLGMALGTVTARNLFHAALFLVGTFAGVAVLYVLLEAEFLAVSQVVVYIGAIATLIIFAIMLSRSMMGKEAGAMNKQWLFAAGGSALLFIVLAMLLSKVPFATQVAPVPPDTIEQIGSSFVGVYVIPFEVASVLLLVALIGAIMLARERHG
ncbi:MAG: NADH-quinone oxidoreductase subunit J [Chloroflexi bacterium]|nr:NADH-quinone oxidoreductase subunit J [Chloroflexota bacterium]